MLSQNLPLKITGLAPDWSFQYLDAQLLQLSSCPHPLSQTLRQCPAPAPERQWWRDLSQRQNWYRRAASFLLLLVPHIPKFLPLHPHSQQGHAPPIPNLSVSCFLWPVAVGPCGWWVLWVQLAYHCLVPGAVAAQHGRSPAWLCLQRACYVAGGIGWLLELLVNIHGPVPSRCRIILPAHCGG